ncbi:hypothetical protein D9M69_496180 [compost metagenome]
MCVRSRYAQACLGGPQRIVGIRHLRAQQHQQVFTIGPGREVESVRRLDGTAEAPPEVQFPGDVEAGAVLPEVRVLRVAPAGLVALEVEAIGAGLLELRVAAALGDAQLGAGFQHPQAGDLQVGIVAVRLEDQSLQRRVLEHLPPLPVVWLRTEEAGLLEGGAVPVFDPGFARWLEIRPQAHTAAEAEHAEQEQPARVGATPHHEVCSSGLRRFTGLHVLLWVFHPLPEQLITDRQDHRTDEQADEATGDHAAQGADEDHRHGDIDAAAKQ